MPPRSPVLGVRPSGSMRISPRDQEPISPRFTLTTTSMLPSSPPPSDHALRPSAITRLSVTARQNSRGSALYRRDFASSTSAQPVIIDLSDCALPCVIRPPATISSSNQPLAFRRRLNDHGSAIGTRSWSGFFLSKSRSRSGPGFRQQDVNGDLADFFYRAWGRAIARGRFLATGGETDLWASVCRRSAHQRGRESGRRPRSRRAAMPRSVSLPYAWLGLDVIRIATASRRRPRRSRATWWSAQPVPDPQPPLK